MTEDIKHQITEMNQELKRLSEEIIRLTVVNEHQLNERQTNSIKIDSIVSEFTQAKGAITLLKAILSIIGLSGVSFCTWIVAVNIELQKELATLNQRVASIEHTHQIIKDIHATNEPK